MNYDDSLFDWRDGITDLALEGRGYPQSAAPYTRLPSAVEEVVPPNVWRLSLTSIGFNARFSTNSDEVAVRWKVAPATMPLPGFSAMAYCGIDVYARGEDGAWTHKVPGAPDFASGEGELHVPWTPGEECMVYLPVRVRPERFAGGVKAGASFRSPRPRATS